MTIRAVIDTNVVISGLLSPSGTPAKVIHAAGVSFQLVWSPGIVAECLRVIDYPRVAKALNPPGRAAQAREMVLALAAGADMVAHEMLPCLTVVKADPDDDLFLATALAGGALVVVTGDRRHLLPLGEFGGVRVVDPATFLVDLDCLLSSVREAAAAYAPARSSPVPPPPVPSLHDPRTRRIDAKRLATYLDVPHRALAWLNIPHGELSGKTPLSLVMARKAQAVPTSWPRHLAEPGQIMGRH